MFPDDKEILIEESAVPEDATVLGASFLFDFAAGDFILNNGSPVKVQGIENIKIWIEKILRTEKFKFRIYATGEENEYGISLLNLVNQGLPMSFVQNEIEREITEALAMNPEIASTGSYVFTGEKRKLVCAFNVKTIYGDSFTQEVTI